jgi:hypothetical protein
LRNGSQTLTTGWSTFCDNSPGIHGGFRRHLS